MTTKISGRYDFDDGSIVDVEAIKKTWPGDDLQPPESKISGEFIVWIQEGDNPPSKEEILQEFYDGYEEEG